jgi:hypothetical protein
MSNTENFQVKAYSLLQHNVEGENNLLATAQAQHQVQRAVLLDVVVGESAAVLQPLAREDETLLVGGDALLVLDLGLHGVDSVGRLHFKSDALASQEVLGFRTMSEVTLESWPFFSTISALRTQPPHACSTPTSLLHRLSSRHTACSLSTSNMDVSSPAA